MTPLVSRAKHALTHTQLRALTSPIRLAIVQRLEMDMEGTARELAIKMGRAATSLYHHLQQLEQAGLVRVVAERIAGGRPEAVYGMAVGRLSSSEVVKTAQGRRTYGRAGVRIADAGARAFSTAVIGGICRFDGESRNAAVRHYVLKADRRKLAELNRVLVELEECAAHPCEEGEEIQLTILLSPLQSKG